jgi:hypothetical protein
VELGEYRDLGIESRGIQLTIPLPSKDYNWAELAALAKQRYSGSSTPVPSNPSQSFPQTPQTEKKPEPEAPANLHSDYEYKKKETLYVRPLFYFLHSK